MLKSILVGLDGSAYSAAAVELGIRWAPKFHALLVGLGIVDQPTITRPQPVPLGAGAFKSHRDETLLADARQKVEQFLKQFSTQCAGAGVACKLLEDVGSPTEQILSEAQRYDLILLGKQTYFHFETQDKPDDTLTRVVKNSPRPVVTVPEQLQSGTSIVVAYDGSLQATRTLQAFEALRMDLTAQAVHVVSAHSDQAVAQRTADIAVEYLGAHEIKALPHALVSSSPAACLIDQVKKLGAGLLVMGAYGQPALKEFFFGSVTRTLLKETTVPLFLYH